jgi:fatty-acyl-CoA synthase
MTLSLESRAQLWGDRTAVVDTGQNRTLSYADLAAAARDAAGRLAAWDIDPGDRVAILAPNSVDYLALLFGARRRGATLAPVSQRLADDTVATLLDRLDPELVVAAEQFRDLAGEGSVAMAEFLGREPATDAAGESDAEPLFLHTGGTTGVPKIVPVSERQLEWNAITESVAWGLDEETVSVSVLPLFHTGGWNLQTLPTLYSGGTVVLMPAFDPATTLESIEEYGATQLFAVAAIYRAMADHPDFADTDFSTVEWVMSGGGPCPETVMEPYRERGLTFVQGYGCTEGGPNNLYLPPEREDTAEKSDRVGRPFPDCEARLVEDGSVVAGEGTGELHLRGPVTAERYLETEEDTFGDDSWVATGDVAHRDADGDYAIVGRTDNMFVSGGENVYPEEIEDTLEGHPDVDGAGVTPVAHDKWGQVPKAVVVGDVSAEELDEFARENLADFEVPHEYVFVESLPETGAGKLDRDALAGLDG